MRKKARSSLLLGRWSKLVRRIYGYVWAWTDRSKGRKSVGNRKYSRMGGSLYADLRETVKSFGCIRKALNVMSDEFRELSTFRRLLIVPWIPCPLYTFRRLTVG